MDAVTSYGVEFPVSVWMKRLKSAEVARVIVVIEPVERSSAHFTINEKVHYVMYIVIIMYNYTPGGRKYGLRYSM